ncbi:MAG: site-2 protease family protein [Verrucomicrobia subdivision 3 bacterium]|nr:site-2 protease family protein [Limisphaerales bacterium]
MAEILNILYVIGVVFLLFGAAIFVHEFGHFWVALKRGLVVEEFAIGFGPIIWSKEHEGILYSIRAIPAGGFVKLPQMLTSEAIEGTADSDEGKGRGEGEGERNQEGSPEELPPVSPLSKILVAFAGPLMNVVFAIVIAVLLWQIGLPRQVSEPVIGYVASHSEEYKIGVRPGDRIVAINDKPVEAWQDVVYTVLDSEGSTVKLKIVRGDKTHTFDAPAGTWDGGIRRLRLDNHDEMVVGKLGEANQGGLFIGSGLKSDDRILKVDDQPVYSQYHFLDLALVNPGSPKTITVERDKKEVVVPFATPQHPRVSVGAIPELEHGTWDLLLSKIGWDLEPLQSTPAMDADMWPGDIIHRANGESVSSVSQFIGIIRASDDNEITLETERTQKVLKRVEPSGNYVELGEEHGLITGEIVRITATKAPEGLAIGVDYFARVDGDEIQFHKTSSDANEGNNPVTFTTAGTEVHVFADSAANEKQTVKITPRDGRLGIGLAQPIGLVFKPEPIRYVEQRPGPTPMAQISDVLNKVAITFKALGRGQESGVGAKDLSGPIGIFGMLSIQVNTDLRLALSFLVLLNINLAILNLLPVPVLDGGHILLSLVEWVRKKPVSVRVQEYFTTVFAVLLLGFFLFVTFADVKRVPLLHDIFNRDTQIKQTAPGK